MTRFRPQCRQSPSRVSLRSIKTVAIVLLTVNLVLSQRVHGQVTSDVPEGITVVGIDDRSGKQLPLKTSFVDSQGRIVTLSTYFDGEHPVILTFNYASCPMLCRLQLNGLVESLRQLEWTAGQQFRVISISIDPSETTQQAAISKQNHLQAYGRPGADDGWVFLTGRPTSIQAATQAAGFSYQYLPKQREFAHTAAAIICMPDGVISRYLYGVQFESETLRLSLTEAAGGRIGSPMDQLLLFCFRYDSATGKYVPAAWSLMRLGAFCTVLCLTVVIYRFRRPGPSDGNSETPNVEQQVSDGPFNSESADRTFESHIAAPLSSFR